jgi:ATP-dependent protease ClpP protease subunit
MAYHTGKALEQIERDMERDFYLDAQEAKAYGLVDAVLHNTVVLSITQMAAGGVPVLTMN